jgi:hypothetical protein
MAGTYDVLQPDGTVVQYRSDQFAEFCSARSHAQRDRLTADGWIALDERIEAGEAPAQPSALSQAFAEAVTPPPEAPTRTVYILGRLKAGEEGTKVV